MAGLDFTSLAGRPFAVRTIAAAGSVQGDATSMASYSAMIWHVTGADATKGVKLPPAQGGKFVVIKNADAANAILKVYPSTGDQINDAGANVALSVAAKKSILLFCLDATTWQTILSA